jgi:hypothetical protein
MSANHGSTPAAWAGTGIVMIGFMIGGLGLVVGSMPMFWVGVACAPLGIVVGFVMAKMGLGGEPAQDR